MNIMLGITVGVLSGALSSKLWHTMSHSCPHRNSVLKCPFAYMAMAIMGAAGAVCGALGYISVN